MVSCPFRLLFSLLVQLCKNNLGFWELNKLNYFKECTASNHLIPPILHSPSFLWLFPSLLNRVFELVSFYLLIYR